MMAQLTDNTFKVNHDINIFHIQFMMPTLHAASMVLHSGPADGSQ